MLETSITRQGLEMGYLDENMEWVVHTEVTKNLLFRNRVKIWKALNAANNVLSRQQPNLSDGNVIVEAGYVDVLTDSLVELGLF